MKKSFVRSIWSVLLAVICWSFTTIVFAAPEEGSIIHCVREYVEGLVFTLDYQNESNYKPEQFDSIEGYIIARNYMIQRDGYRHISEKGIHDISIDSFQVLSIDLIDNYYEVFVSIYYHYLFNGAVDNYSRISYRVKVKEDHNTLCCTDISSRDDELIREILFEIMSQGITDHNEKVAFVDNYFAEMEKNIQSSPKQNIYQTTEEVFGLTSGFKAVKKMSMHLQRHPYSYHSNIRYNSVLF